MKGDATCHTTNAAYRAGWEETFVNRYWVALSKGADQVLVRVEASNQSNAVRAAELANPGYAAVSSGLLREETSACKS